MVEFNPQELEEWWHGQAADEVEPLLKKMTEYGGRGRAVDLIDIGVELGRLMGREDISDAEATELGIYFYVRGKFSRWFAALSEGNRVSDDTLYDIGIYIRMAQRVRKTGGWPV